MACELNPHDLHQRGLSAVTIDGQFDVAKQYYDRAINGFQAEGSIIDVGRVHRDMARVGAGLCDLSLRDLSVERANEIHEAAYIDAPIHSTLFAASELAATLHVGARVSLARYLDGPGEVEVLESSIKKWARAYYLLIDYVGTNEDYLEQVISHGSLAIAGFGRYRNLDFGLELTRDPLANNMSTPQRKKVVNRAGKLLVARRIGIPVHKVSAITDGIAQAVAGPYRIAA